MNKKRKKLMIIILAVMLVLLGAIGGYYWYNNTCFVITDDARVTGDLIKVNTQITGKLLEFNIEEGERVSRDQILGRQDMTNLSDANLEQSLIRAPISGIILKRLGNVGEVAAAGQATAIIVDPQKLYITANVEETKLGKVKQGQMVDITIDQMKGKKFTGKVKYVGQASNSAFSILPASTSGTFTKVIQRVPVKIELDKSNAELLPGTNAIVKIHVN